MGIWLLAFLQTGPPVQSLKTDETAPPRYPNVMVQARIAGTVSLEFVVDSAGRVSRSSLLIFSSTNKAFNEAVEESVLNQAFEPAVVNGTRTARRVHLTVEFLRDGLRTGPQLPIWEEIVTPTGLIWRTGWIPVKRPDPAPVLSEADRLAALRAVVTTVPVPASDSARMLCLSELATEALDEHVSAHFASISRKVSPPLPCPRSYASPAKSPDDPVPPPGHIEPTYLRLAALEVWTPDVVWITATYGGGISGRVFYCETTRSSTRAAKWTARCEYSHSFAS